MRKVFIKNEAVVYAESEGMEITSNSAESYDVSKLTEVEIKKLRKNPKKNLNLLKKQKVRKL